MLNRRREIGDGIIGISLQRTNFRSFLGDLVSLQFMPAHHPQLARLRQKHRPSQSQRLEIVISYQEPKEM